MSINNETQPHNPDALIDRRRLARRLSFWRFLAILLAVVAIGVVFSGIANDSSDDFDGDAIAVLPLNGVIFYDPFVEEALIDAAEDDDIKALIVEINSPGGGTVGSEVIFTRLREVAEKKPVVATMGTAAASGGYIAALATDRIFAWENTITGSIGVLMQSAELTELMDKIGIKPETIKSGKYKAEPSPYGPMSDEVRAHLQGMIDDSHAWFLRLLTERRGLEAAEAKALADGRIFNGRQAVKLGLVDELGGQKEAIAWLETEKSVEKDLPLVEIGVRDEEALLRRIMDSAHKSLFSKALGLDGLQSLWHP